MAQHSEIDYPALSYNRSDYAALRAYCLKLPFTVIERYYSEDSPQRQQGLERFLIRMRDDLIERASMANPNIAEVLRKARSSQSITDKALAILIEAASAKPAPPYPNQPIAQWFRARVAHCLLQAGIDTIENLKQWIITRGHRWWVGIPRIGQLRAQAIVRWLQRHASTLGELDPQSLQPPSSTNVDKLVYLNPALPHQLAPLTRLVVPHGLSGAQGINRCQYFAFIQAKNDHEAVLAYLSRYQGQFHTHRTYQKELERFLLWAIVIAKKPLSSLLVDECEAYKLFVAAPCPEFIGRKNVPRFSPRWKPFNAPLSPHSQRQAIQILRTFFQWLVEVRYLAGNPWIAVRDPEVAKALSPVQIERALPAALWDKFIAQLTEQANTNDDQQARAALAAILLMGDSGLRREETAQACRSNLQVSAFAHDTWELKVLGKGNKWREVPVSQRTVEALKAHWHDREIDFDLSEPRPLISPLILPETPQSKQRHRRDQRQSYTGDGLHKLLISVIKKLCQGNQFSQDEVAKLLVISAHAFRHTFGTQAVAKEVPIDVVQKVLGHASVATTSLYVKAEKQRVMEEVGKYFKQMTD